ncbi:hypothetical protein EOA60_06775 [Mesorhizobium sp. M1A.F.Ca.IN.020.06.1.1]|uniref:hypothetical protein n=2 Tax=Mesorhizobium TaxID=68287 RepID=UPI000FD291D1|nr:MULTISPECIES: hypothetical protein [unclassified Mesorhizobium]RUV90231.1 hypothetical protein EOA51_00495 [Mesorhizobium sp. M1A.F.Ca.IN.020.32.1.1]RUW34001.1 hypothetical protein EOA60_06775 [Mesorhizobium sp. M1A.F.Ca.IN.020.06.1.1]RWF81279.1 MAG: hypothetical protein EOQ35_14545 [Mesorhizobium sp.]RWG04213.1 MAG: hypothetical protein EOQ38_06645 [Mesorhizobium sp.]RWG91952.1 MAG: hypothetical protein EOQ68_04490 [Mesorhizobium sp.]
MILAHITSSFRETFPARASEWALATMLFGWSVVLFANPTLFADTPSFAAGLAQIVPQGTLAVLCGIAGAGRLVCLGINGAWRRSPHLRSVGAFIATGFWFIITLGLLKAGANGTGLAIYPVLMFLDSYNVIRAAGEAGLSDQRHGRVTGDGHPN